MYICIYIYIYTDIYICIQLTFLFCIIVYEMFDIIRMIKVQKNMFCSLLFLFLSIIHYYLHIHL